MTDLARAELVRLLADMETAGNASYAGVDRLVVLAWVGRLRAILKAEA